MQLLNGKAVFAVGTGRCGTKFMHELMSRHANVQSCHERRPLIDAFDRYCRFNRLPVDERGFLATKRRDVEADLDRAAVSFEASAYLSYAVHRLWEELEARVVLLVRAPHRVVISYLDKGWYRAPLVRDDPSLAAGFQPELHLDHHSFSRIVPRGEEGRHWEEQSRTGQLAWFWNRLNIDCLALLERVPESHKRVIPIETFDFAAYSDFCEWLEVTPSYDRSGLEDLIATKPNSRNPAQTTLDWSPTEQREFEVNVRPAAERLGYEWNLAALADDLSRKIP